MSFNNRDLRKRVKTNAPVNTRIGRVDVEVIAVVTVTGVEMPLSSEEIKVRFRLKTLIFHVRQMFEQFNSRLNQKKSKSITYGKLVTICVITLFECYRAIAWLQITKSERPYIPLFKYQAWAAILNNTFIALNW